MEILAQDAQEEPHLVAERHRPGSKASGIGGQVAQAVVRGGTLEETTQEAGNRGVLRGVDVG